jgi:hypothetical protein
MKVLHEAKAIELAYNCQQELNLVALLSNFQCRTAIIGPKVCNIEIKTCRFLMAQISFAMLLFVQSQMPPKLGLEYLSSLLHHIVFGVVSFFSYTTYHATNRG